MCSFTSRAHIRISPLSMSLPRVYGCTDLSLAVFWYVLIGACYEDAFLVCLVTGQEDTPTSGFLIGSFLIYLYVLWETRYSDLYSFSELGSRVEAVTHLQH